MKRSALWLRICLLSVLFVVAGAGPLLALEPQMCDMRVVRGAVLPLREPTAGLSEVLALHITGGWSTEGPPSELHVWHADSGEERILLRWIPTLTGFPSDPRLGFYRIPDDGLKSGRWRVAPEDFGVAEGTIEVAEGSGFYVVETSTVSSMNHRLDVEARGDIVDEPWTNPSLRERAARALVVNVEVPGAWRERVPDDALLGVRLGVDAPPGDDAELAEGDLFVALERDTVVLPNSFNYFCFSSVATDWLDGTTLHGLLWPVGQDPTQVSMRFTIELADLRAEITRRHHEETGTTEDAFDPPEPVSSDAAGDEDDTGADDAEGIANRDSESASGAGCSVLPVGSPIGSGAAVVLLAGVLAHRRRRTALSQGGGGSSERR